LTRTPGGLLVESPARSVDTGGKEAPMTTDTPERILRAADRLFTARGYTATSMREVAKEAGIGKATIYHHFPDKESIVLTLLDRQLLRVKETLGAIESEPDPRKRFRIAAEQGIAGLFESADIMQIVRREVPGGRSRIQAVMMPFLRKNRSLLAQAVREGTEQGTFRAVEPEEAARVFMTMIQGAFAAMYLSGERPQTAFNPSAAMLDIYFRGIDADGRTSKERA
jgi:TetR/AcrR family transcriptional regulator, cholesterol catabolism regulator